MKPGTAIREAIYSFNANLYYMDYTNQLVLTGEINDVGSAVMTNVKDSYRTGIEISGGVRFTLVPLGSECHLQQQQDQELYGICG